jgi:uncharacterized membrane protein
MSTANVESIRFLRRILWSVFVVSVFGLAFSATLSYQELAGVAASCPATGAAGTILGLPACVYGFAMYAILVSVSGLGLFQTRAERAQHRRFLQDRVKQ